jgi:hypothetical protein
MFYSTYTGLAHLCAGLCCGISGLAAGACIGIVGDYGVRAVGYRASQITLFPTSTEKEGYSTIPDGEEGGHAGEDISGSDDQKQTVRWNAHHAYLLRSSCTVWADCGIDRESAFVSM